MKIRNLFPALVALCSLVTWVETRCSATTTNIFLYVQPYSVSSYTTNFTGNFNGPYPFGVYEGDSVQSVAAADINGDGYVDLIGADDDNNSGFGTLTVLTNDGTGNFVSDSVLSVGKFPLAVIAVDVNGDGKVDLISANGTSPGTLTVLTNNGTGSFTVASSPRVGNDPDSVASAVIDGSGKLSLICANQSSSTLTVLTNMDGGIFVSNASYSVGTSPLCVVAADVNNDGKVDLISANRDGPSLTVLTNDGSGHFRLAATLNVTTNNSSSSEPESVVAFTNTDGKVDLACANTGNSTLTVLTNRGGGQFGIAFTFNSSDGVSAPAAVTAADVNGDGYMDLICANSSDNTLTVLTNDGSGGFVLASTPGTGGVPVSVVAADVDGDGGLDLIDADENDGTLSVNYDSPTVNPIIVSGIAISWTNSAASSSFGLQQNANLNNPAGWTDVSPTQVLTNGLKQVGIPFNSNGQLFYRLKSPYP